MLAIRYLHKMFASEVTVAIILRRGKSLSTVQTQLFQILVNVRCTRYSRLIFCLGVFGFVMFA